MADIKSHYKYVAGKMRKVETKIEALRASSGDHEAIKALLAKQELLQHNINELLRYRSIAQNTCGRSYDRESNILFPSTKVTIQTGLETGIHGQVIHFAGKGRGRNRICVIKLANSLRLVRRKGKYLSVLDAKYSDWFKRMMKPMKHNVEIIKKIY